MLDAKHHLEDLANQVRGAFFGAEVQRLQRDGEEMPVYIRLPESERDAVADLLVFRVSTPGGGRVPLDQVATVSLGVRHKYHRREGERIVSVTADTDESVVTTDEVNRQLELVVLPMLMRGTQAFHSA